MCTLYSTVVWSTLWPILRRANPAQPSEHIRVQVFPLTWTSKEHWQRFVIFMFCCIWAASSFSSNGGELITNWWTAEWQQHKPIRTSEVPLSLCSSIITCTLCPMLSMQEAPWDFGISCDLLGGWETWTNKTITDTPMPSQSQPVCIALLFFVGPSKIGSKRSLGMLQKVAISCERELRCAIYSGPPSHNGTTGFVEILCVISVSLARVIT